MNINVRLNSGISLMNNSWLHVTEMKMLVRHMLQEETSSESYSSISFGCCHNFPFECLFL